MDDIVVVMSEGMARRKSQAPGCDTSIRLAAYAWLFWLMAESMRASQLW